MFESSQNHPLAHSVCGKIVFHEIGPWCQRGWGLLNTGEEKCRELEGDWDSLRFWCRSDSCAGEEQEREELPCFKPRAPDSPPNADNIRGAWPFFAQSYLCKWILSYPHPDIHSLLWNLCPGPSLNSWVGYVETLQILLCSKRTANEGMLNAVK